ncbi:MAG: helix-turn-helix domain-containing protein [Acidobacteria bacterium]|nr:helix-turn-helix domain-containing protein [Acidobacteriota bacterium]
MDHSDDPDPRESGDFVQSLERGLNVLRAFDGTHPTMTVADVAKSTGLTRATARRLLHTLVQLGYADTDGKWFELTPKVLDLGHAYVSSLQLPDIAQPYMEALSDQVHESVSASVLDGHEIVYVARVPTQRIMAISLAIGSRLPAVWTSMGRVMLADRTDAEVRSMVGPQVAPPSPRALTDVDALIDEIKSVRQQGWCLLDQELEEGIRSVAAPLHDRRGRVVAAINVGTHASRVTLKQLRGEILPRLLDTARAIDARLRTR